jgi:hypothetical protein
MLQPGARTRRARVMAGAKPVPFLSFSFFWKTILYKFLGQWLNRKS